MNPLFFGSGAAPLYGVLHPARGTARRGGVLLCYPFGQEYMRAHRAFRQLALLLSGKGFHVLRFDYRGTGDSAGDLDEGVLAGGWLDDIDLAVEELRESAGVDDVSIVGLRLGALLAAEACRRRTDISRLVLWDPVVSGAEYESELLTEIARETVSADEVASGNGLDEQGALYFNGFALPRTLRQSLAVFDLRGSAPADVPRILHVVSHESDVQSAIRERWATHRGYRYQLAPAPHDWNYVDRFGGILLPQPVIQAIVNWLDAESRP